MPTDEISRLDIEAYIDGELDLPHRLAVEDHLSRNPDAAAQVMGDFRNRSALQMLAASDTPCTRSLADTVDKLRNEGRSPWRRPALAVTAMALLLVSAITIFGRQPAPPAYVSLAATSHQTLANRLGFASSQPAAGRTDALLLASRIAVPRLPSDWQVTDVELLDAPTGPAMLIAVQTMEGHHLSILAIRKHSSAPRQPDAVRHGRQSVAYWRKGDFSYALTGEGDPDQIDATADALAASWRT